MRNVVEKEKKRKNPIWRGIRWFLLFYIFYLIIGAFAPFVNVQKVSKENREILDKVQYRANEMEECLDRAEIIEKNADALSVRLSMFEEAEEEIIFSTFDIRPGYASDDVFSSLLAQAERGVKVRILVDGLYGMVHMNGENSYLAAGSHPNIEIRYYNEPNLLKPWTMNGRLHDKYIIIDKKYLLMGGRNTFDYFLGEYEDRSIGYDREVLIYNTGSEKKEATENDSVIYEVIQYFEDTWKLPCTKTVFAKVPFWKKKKVEAAKENLLEHYALLEPEKKDFYQDTVPVKKATFIHNPTNILAKEPYVFYQLKELMLTAKKEVIIQTPYAVFSKDMYEGIEEIAKTVPNAILMLNSVAVGDNFMASSDYLHNKKKVNATGVSLYEYIGDASSHGKSILIDDDISVIGSYNLDMRSTYVDTETMLVLESEELNQSLRGYMEGLLADSLLITENGAYSNPTGKDIPQIPGWKKGIFFFTSRLFQLFRFVI